jgi:hypothetical protein
MSYHDKTQTSRLPLIERPFKVSDYVTLNGACAAAAIEFLSDMTREAFLQQGRAAFDCPKSAACVHEAAHCIVYAVQGVVPKSVCIRRDRQSGRDYWGGVTMGPPDPPVDRHSDARQDYESASLKIAGLVAEMVFDRESFRFASSLDELLLVKVIAATIADKTGRDQEEICIELFARTAVRLIDYRGILLDIADELRRRERILTRRLTAHLQPILMKSSSTPWGQPPRGDEFERAARVIVQMRRRTQ